MERRVLGNGDVHGHDDCGEVGDGDVQQDLTESCLPFVIVRSPGSVTVEEVAVGWFAARGPLDPLDIARRSRQRSLIA
jgi:hypothetical protein